MFPLQGLELVKETAVTRERLPTRSNGRQYQHLVLVFAEEHNSAGTGHV